MLLRSAIALCEVGFFVMAASSLVLAAVPTTTIQSWRDSATDVVSFTVLSVDLNMSSKPYGGPNGSVTKYDITLTARVDAVDRSVNSLTPQTTIIVHYVDHYTDPAPILDGGYGNPILKIHEKAKAYLKKKDGNTFELANPIMCLEKL